MALGKKRFKKQSFKKLVKNSADTGVPFSDSEFKADDNAVFSSIAYKSSLEVGKIVWKRPRELSDDPHLLFLEKLGPAAPIEFLGFGPNDWLIAAASAIARDKSMVYQIFPKEQFHFLNGIFKIRLWSFGKWVKIVIDDKLPSFDNRLVFASSNCGSLFWVPLLEKAYAKLYGSYERMASMSSLSGALTDFTGVPVETVDIKEGDDAKDYFRLVAEELDRHAIVVVKTRDSSSVAVGLQKKRYYILDSVKKPAAGSFKKTIKEGNASVKLIATYYDERHNKRETKPREIWLNVEKLSQSIESITICHLKLSKSVSVCSGDGNTQFSFDVAANGQEVMLEVIQEPTDNPIDVGFKIYKVEINRKFKMHSFPEEFVFECEPTKQRNIFRRIKLDYGRYVIRTNCSNSDTTLMIRLYTEKSSSLRTLLQDMPRNLLPFLGPKYPKYVSRVVVKEAHGLEKQDRFGSANPYCVIHCGRQTARSHPIHDALSPNFDNFSAIFYHDKFIPIVVEVWHSSILVDSIMGRAEVVPKVDEAGSEEPQELDLCDKKGNATSGTVTIVVQTSEDLRLF